MITRRHFLGTLAAGAAVYAAKPLLPASGALAAKPGGTTRVGTGLKLPTLGLGGVAFGNGFNQVTSERDSLAALEAAWEGGIRYYDTSPWYGLGLSERRMGRIFQGKPRDEYIISSKVGRILTPNADAPEKVANWKQPDKFDYHYDYSASATRRSVEESLQRLGVPSLDIVFIHDISVDNSDMKQRWPEYFEQAAKGAMPELTKMREEGLIKGWGLGVNTLPPILKTLEVADPDVFLAAAWNYQLMDHENGVNKLLPAVREKNVSLVIGSPLGAGFMAGRNRYLYNGEMPRGLKEKRARIEAIAKAHGTDLRTVALHFAAAPKEVASIIPGARTAEQVQQNIASMKARIPSDLWTELKQEKLIAANAPVPA